MATFQILFDKYAFAAFEKQYRLSSLIGEHRWLLDVGMGRVTFNNRLVFDVQFLGTESTISQTWLWADANRALGCPEDSLERCHMLRAVGQQYGIEELSADSFRFVDEVGKPTGHTLAMVATCLVNASCYYRAPHENGAVYFTMTDSRIDAQGDLDLAGFRKAFTELMWVPGDMKKRLVSYCFQKGYIHEESVGDELRFNLRTGEQVSVTFRLSPTGGTEIALNI